jgi:hypothetical protein
MRVYKTEASVENCNIAPEMAKLKAIVIPLLVCICLFITTAVSSCLKDNCGNIVCANEGVCVDGLCTCPSGYEGATCTEQWSEKFNGEWKATDKFLNAPQDSLYQYTILVEGAKDSFWVYGLADTMKPVKCMRQSSRVFTITAQTLDSSITINSGRGTLDVNTGKITGYFNYRLRDTVYVPEINFEDGYEGPVRQFLPQKRDTTMTTYFSWSR